MTEYKDIKPGIYSGKKIGGKAGYNLILIVDGFPPFCDVYFYNVSTKMYGEIKDGQTISQYEFNEFIGELPKGE